jgi:hypothetical protein
MTCFRSMSLAALMALTLYASPASAVDTVALPNTIEGLKTTYEIIKEGDGDQIVRRDMSLMLLRAMPPPSPPPCLM